MAKDIPVFQVEDSVPIPVQRSSYPLDDLAVGQSILFPRSNRSSVAARASRLKKAEGKVFTIRVVDEANCRVWRTK